MATARWRGMREARANLLRLRDALTADELQDCVAVGARELKREIEARTPIARTRGSREGHAPLQVSTIIYWRQNREARFEKDMEVSALVGPSKKAFHGYFLDQGWKAPTGPRVTYTTERGDRWNPKGTAYTTGRRRRGAGGAAHSQMGRPGFREIPGRKYIAAAFASAHQRALDAIRRKLREKIAKVLNGNQGQ